MNRSVEVKCWRQQQRFSFLSSSSTIMILLTSTLVWILLHQPCYGFQLKPQRLSTSSSSSLHYQNRRQHYDHPTTSRILRRQVVPIIDELKKKMTNIISYSAISNDDTVIASSSTTTTTTKATAPIIPSLTQKINGEMNNTLSMEGVVVDTEPGTSDVRTTLSSSVVPVIKTSNESKQPKVPFHIVLWKFTRPHTLIGSALAIPAIHLLAAPIESVSSLSSIILLLPSILYSILYATIPALLMNLYITGLNQITDVEIDKINKPNLPIAAGILKVRTAIITCCMALFVSLYMGHFGPSQYSTSGLQVALWGSGILGTLYSVKPFRLKRYPVFAALCIVAVRGTIINASFFAHAMAAVFQQPTATVLSCLLNDPRCLFSSIFFGMFGIVIALMKDVPDVLGDQSSNIRTFSVRVGPQRIFHLSRKLLMGLFYVCTIGFIQRAVTATSITLTACRSITAIACLIAARSVRQQSKSIDPTNPSQVYEYYMHLWKIFYMSYAMLPFAR